MTYFRACGVSLLLILGGVARAHAAAPIEVPACPAGMEEAIAHLRYQVTIIEQQPGDRAAAFTKLAGQAEALRQANPHRPEPLIWKGIALAAQAKYQGLSALRSIREARDLLEAALRMDEKAAGPIAYNALGLIYHKAPGWPISFGDDKKAEEYFKKALAAASVLDTHYRYGEFLMDRGHAEEGRKHLQQALDLPDRPGHKEDPIKKKDIRALLDRSSR